MNGENVADGGGITPRLADRLLAVGGGRRDARQPHVGTRRHGAVPRRLRARDPAGESRELRAGTGLAVVEAADGTPVAVCNVLGQLFLDVPVGPFEVLDASSEEARSRANVVLVDFHAEATSEKMAVARWLDGRVTAVIGTHTHVQTADARSSPAALRPSATRA